MPCTDRHCRVSPHLLAVAAIVVICFWIYRPALEGAFVWDDRSLFEQNAHRWQWSNLKDLLTRQDNLFTDHNNGFYRPLPNLLFLLDRSLWGLKPAGFHLTNLVLHTAAAVTLWHVGLRLTGSVWAALVAALVFALHPANVESVAWVNGRNNILTGLFYLLAFGAHLRWRAGNRRRWCALACAALAGSVLSKENAVTFPLIVAGHELVFGAFAATRQLAGAMARRALPYLAVLAGFVLLRGLFLPAMPELHLSVREAGLRVLNLPHMVWRYGELLLCPLGLNALHQTEPVVTIADGRFFAQGLGLTVAAGVWAWSRRRLPLVFWAIGWVLVNLIPFLGLIPIPNVHSLIAERYLYLASAGLALALAGLVVRALASRRLVARVAAGTAAALVVVVFGHLTMARSRVWTSETALWQATVETAPDSFKAWINLAIATAQSGNLAQAVVQARQAIALKPGDPTAHYILGNLLAGLARHQEAIEALETALRLDPEHRDARLLLRQLRPDAQSGNP